MAYVNKVRDITSNVDHSSFTMADVESNIVRCPDQTAAKHMIDAINEVRTKGDSCGGEVTCIVRNCPKGLGSPVFDKLEAELAKAMMSLPASKGFEIGSGFSGSSMLGSQHNDAFYMTSDGQVSEPPAVLSALPHTQSVCSHSQLAAHDCASSFQVRTKSNRSGGIQGGISNGEDIVIKVAFKPTSTIGVSQQTVTREGVETELRARGRHDPCVVPRAVPMVESMVAIVIADQLLVVSKNCY